MYVLLVSRSIEMDSVEGFPMGKRVSILDCQIEAGRQQCQLHSGIPLFFVDGGYRVLTWVDIAVST